ncbi:hypothetical protein [Streptomyces sp. NPDC048650]|uniref:hypothetical protein n=1 Tax=Streptomyces sp. NPDC048650 TaxID=3365583 RepID=UPI0037144124
MDSENDPRSGAAVEQAVALDAVLAQLDFCVHAGQNAGTGREAGLADLFVWMADASGESRGVPAQLQVSDARLRPLWRGP